MPGSLCRSRRSLVLPECGTWVWANCHIPLATAGPLKAKAFSKWICLPRRRRKGGTRELPRRTLEKWEGLAGNPEAAAQEPFPSLRKAPGAESAPGKDGLPAGMGASSVGGPGRPGVSRDDHVVTAGGPGHTPSLPSWLSQVKWTVMGTGAGPRPLVT